MPRIARPDGSAKDQLRQVEIRPATTRVLVQAHEPEAGSPLRSRQHPKIVLSLLQLRRDAAMLHKLYNR